MTTAIKWPFLTEKIKGRERLDNLNGVSMMCSLWAVSPSRSARAIILGAVGRMLELLAITDLTRGLHPSLSIPHLTCKRCLCLEVSTGSFSRMHFCVFPRSTGVRTVCTTASIMASSRGMYMLLFFSRQLSRRTSRGLCHLYNLQGSEGTNPSPYLGNTYREC